MEVSSISKLSIIFPGGDQMTSVLLEKEKDTVIQELLKRLCTNRGIDLATLKVLDEIGKKSRNESDSGRIKVSVYGVD